jgi:vancomycin resistance protein YoaR
MHKALFIYMRRIAIGAGILSAAAAVVGAALLLYGSQQKLPSGFNLSGWAVGGWTRAQLQQQLDSQLRLLQSQPVLLRSPVAGAASKQLTLGELGVSVKKEQLEAELKLLLEGPLPQRIRQRWALRHSRFELRADIDPAALAKAMRRSWSELYAAEPVDARRIIQANDQIRLEPGRSVQRIDLERLRTRLETLAPQVGTLTDAAAPLGVELEFYEQQPPVTVESLDAQGIEGKITEFTTSFLSSGAGRIHNIQATAASMQDMLLKPGDIFDYEKIVRQTESTSGYQEAPVILNGKLVPGIGGGICQVSSTLYNAVLRTGLEIVERRNHSLPVRYVSPGQDATFASGYINFRFRNSTDHYLLIRSLVTDNQVTVKLFGRLTPSISYMIDSKIVETIPPPIRYLHNSSLPQGTSTKLADGKAGFIAQTYRFKKVNGSIVSKELISRDRYNPEPALYASNKSDSRIEQPKDSNPEKPILEDGVQGPVFD